MIFLRRDGEGKNATYHDVRGQENPFESWRLCWNPAGSDGPSGVSYSVTQVEREDTGGEDTGRLCGGSVRRSRYQSGDNMRSTSEVYNVTLPPVICADGRPAECTTDHSVTSCSTSLGGGSAPAAMDVNGDGQSTALRTSALHQPHAACLSTPGGREELGAAPTGLLRTCTAQDLHCSGLAQDLSLLLVCLTFLLQVC